MLEKSKVLLAVLLSATLIGCSLLSGPALSAPSPCHAPAQKGVRVAIDSFYEALEPYGDWFSMNQYGWVWMPYVSASWRPYTVGRWVYTDAGCTWDSDEPWGWAVYHYGRWLYDASHGWVWVPGEEWAPAWVSWRYGSSYIGWAPLPPVIAWDGSRLSLGGFAIDNWIPPFWYCFVEESVCFRESVSDHIVLSARNETLLKLTKNVTSYTAIECQVINRGVDSDRIEREIGQAISRYKIVDVESRQAECQARVKEDEIAFYRPAVLMSARGRTPQTRASNQPARSSVVTAYILKGLGKERRELERRQKAIFAALRRQHHEELVHPPVGISPNELGRRQKAEQRALTEQNMRERQLLEKRQRKIVGDGSAE